MEKSRGHGFGLDEAIIKKFGWVARNSLMGSQLVAELLLPIIGLLATQTKLKETSDLDERREYYHEYKERKRIIESFLGRGISQIQRDQKRERESRDVRNRPFTRDSESAVS